MSRDHITLVFFVDALGWRLAQELGCFRDLAPHAYRQRTILGYSCAAQPTILTGLDPCAHGHWSMFHRTMRSELAPLRRFDVLPEWIAGHRRVRRRLLAAHRKRSGFTGYYNLYRIPFRLFREFDLSEKRDIYAPDAFDSLPDGSGRVESIFDVLARERVPYRVWNWKTGLEQAFTELSEAISDGPPLGFALLYTAVMDAFLHEHVGDTAAVAAAAAELEECVARAVARAHDSYARVDLLIFSDHGMAETTGEIDLMSAVESLGLEHERDYLAFYDSTMGRFWFHNERARVAITDMLRGTDRGTVLSDDELRSEGVFFEDGRYGELVFLMDPGVLIVPSYMGARAPRGMHGFTPEHEDSDAVIMSNVPIEPAPKRIADSFRIMRDSLEHLGSHER